MYLNLIYKGAMCLSYHMQADIMDFTTVYQL